MITIDITYDAIKIKFDGLLHLHITRSKFIALQSWILSKEQNYCIEFTFTTGNVLCEYDSKEKFETILTELDKVL